MINVPERESGEAGGGPAGEAFDRTALAYHEAGHAVVAHLLGWRLVSVTINEQGGCCASRPGLRVRPRPLSAAALQRDRQRMAADATRSNVTIMLAGPAAEQLATGRMHSATVLERDTAVALARSEKRRVSADRCWKSARRLLLRHWPAIEALAQALLDRGEVLGAQAGGIISAALALGDTAARASERKAA